MKQNSLYPSGTGGQPRPFAGGLSPRDVVPRVVLTIVTCGLFGLYWMAQITNDIHRLSGKPQCTSGGKAVLFSLLTCSLYFYYWLYKISGELVEARREMGLALDAVSNGMYTAVIVVMTFVSAGLSVLRTLAEIPEDAFADMDDVETFLAVLLVAVGASIVFFIVQCIISAIILWIVYRRSDPNPRIVYMLMGLLRTQILTLAFLQASLNDAIQAQPAGNGPSVSV